TFLTPAHPGAVIWGLGPSFSLPTATAYPVKTGTWAGGASAVLLATPGPWVLGSLFQQVWPMHDNGGPPKTNLFLWQYFVNYNFGKGWALATAPSITANWDAADGQKWTVPFGGGISRTLVFNRQPMTLGFQYYYNTKRPDNAASTTVRFIVAFIFPQKRGG
ncbi:MAG: neuromedin U, partial [Terracidiphilus sp.]